MKGSAHADPGKKVNCLEGSVHDPKAKTASPQRHLVDYHSYSHHLLIETPMAPSSPHKADECCVQCTRVSE